jgi:hypothetical protein
VKPTAAGSPSNGNVLAGISTTCTGGSAGASGVGDVFSLVWMGICFGALIPKDGDLDVVGQHDFLILLSTYYQHSTLPLKKVPSPLRRDTECKKYTQF